MQVFQRTLSREVQFSGIGLHTGLKVNVRLVPAPPDTGIVFIRTDISDSPYIKVSPERLPSMLSYATILTNGAASVQTIEHLMAVLFSFGIDNLFVYLDATELPILDGSAAPYIYLIEKSGIKKQSKKRKYLKLTKEVSVKYNSKRIKAEPANGLIIDNTISFAHTYKKVRYQRLVYSHNPKNFKEICKARTFCFSNQVESLRAAGLAKGGSLENAIVIDKYDILNDSGLRMDNEFVAHKTLDLLGDLYVLGYPLLAKITAYRTGHALNAALVKTIYHEKAYKIFELEAEEKESVLPLLADEKSYGIN